MNRITIHLERGDDTEQNAGDSGDGFLHGNVSMSLPGERVLMIGTGNVGLIVSYQLLRGGGEIIAE